ncbi:MAG: cupin domain-containing protein, partial [Ktedonobacterales bacterium]
SVWRERYHDMSENVGDVIDLAALAHAAVAREQSGPLWSHGGDDLNANVLRFAAGDGVPEHVNAELDVLMLVVSGAAVVTLDGREMLMKSGQLIVLPKGSRRAIRAQGGDVVYVTVHRRRTRLMPGRRS